MKMIDVNYLEEFTVTMELKQNYNLGYHLLETWRSKIHGGIERPGGLPPVIAYDAKNGRRIYRAWPDKNGHFGKRENGHPSEIYETDDEPHAQWYSHDGSMSFLSRAIDKITNPNTGEVLGYVYAEPKPCYLEFKNQTLPALDF